MTREELQPLLDYVSKLNRPMDFQNVQRFIEEICACSNPVLCGWKLCGLAYYYQGLSGFYDICLQIVNGSKR